MALLLVLAALVGFRQPIEVNVSPLARVVFDANPRYVNPNSTIEYSLPEATTDGLFDTLYMAEFPIGAGGGSIDFEFPFLVPATRVVVLGWDKQPATTLRITVRDDHGDWRDLQHGDWAPRGNVPPFRQIDRPGSFRTLRLTFRDVDQVVLNSVMCFAAVPRWLAWIYFLGLNLIGPWMVGTAVVLATLGCGRMVLSLGTADPSDLGRRAVAGVACTAVVALVWCLLPRHWAPAAAVMAAGVGIAVREAVWWMKTASTDPDRILVRWLLLAVLLLLCEVTVDTYLVTNRRIIPVDHLLSYLGSKRLVARVPMTDYLAFRPWLVHILFTPLDWISGRFSYWTYLGFMAGLNSLTLIALALFTRRWRASKEPFVVGLIVLLPIMGCFHFLGQRPLSAGLVLMGIYWWTEPTCRRYWAGLALSLAILVHPSALLVLPGGVVYWFAGKGFTNRLLEVLRAIWMPCLTFGLWTWFVRWRYPGLRNDLMLYPIKTHIVQTFDAHWSWWEILRNLPADHWKQLALNRLLQLRHYVWTDNLSQPVADVFRWISLPNVLGFVLSLALLRPATWRVDRAFLWLTVGGPLILHHMFVGQAHGFFHFSPTPFFGLALLVSLCVTQERLAGVRVVLGVSLVELALRRCYLPTLAYFFPADEYCFFATDQLSYTCLSLLLPAAWVVCLVAAYRFFPSGGGRRE